MYCYTRKIKPFLRKHCKIIVSFLLLVVIVSTYNSVSPLVPSSVSRIVQQNDIKYILQWTSPNNIPFVYMGIGRKNFIDRNCRFTNCYVTSNRTFLGNVTNFDAIIFHGPDILLTKPHELPTARSLHQKYVFASIESFANYPLCSDRFDGFFNWTWTYKLDSDARWGYIVVRDSRGNIIGPNKEMHWIKKEDMLPVSDKIKEIIRGKRKAVAWFVSNCYSLSDREYLASVISAELNSKFNLSVDVYGHCGNLQCPRDENRCDELIKKDYFFYLAFENSFSDDYVTEKLLNAVVNNAVPIVYGGANYSRFLPEGSYLDAMKLTLEELTTKINESTHNLDVYSEYLRWTSYYSYHRRNWSPETDDYCGFCELLNDDSKVKRTSIYTKFQKWWESSKTWSFC